MIKNIFYLIVLMLTACSQSYSSKSIALIENDPELKMLVASLMTSPSSSNSSFSLQEHLSRTKYWLENKDKISSIIMLSRNLLRENPSHPKAQSLLLQATVGLTHVLALEISQALTVKNDYQVWKTTKEFEYLLAQTRKYVSFRQEVVEKFQSDQILEAINRTEDSLVQSGREDAGVNDAGELERSVFMSLISLAAPICLVTGNKNLCRATTASSCSELGECSVVRKNGGDSPDKIDQP